MYEDKTYEAILQEKLARVASSLDKREGSIIFDALAPNSLESAMIYVALDTVLNETFADREQRLPYHALRGAWYHASACNLRRGYRRVQYGYSYRHSLLLR